MANVMTVNRIARDLNEVRVQGTVVLSGSYVQAPTGEILDFTKATYPVGLSLPASKGPVSFDMWGNSGFSYGAISQPPIAALQVPIQITTGAASGPTKTELSAGAYGAAITGDKIQFEAVFDYGL
jgi:hypothetical protein